MVADAHLSRRRGNLEAFFRMLTALSEGPGDVVFLGDIFDLWIALPGYENEDHDRFLTWCRGEIKRRRIGFVEGNHEFFVAQTHAPAFTWCTQHAWRRDPEGRLFCHGDRINRADRRYLTFRKATKNPIAKHMLRRLPSGPRLVDRIKRGLEDTNPAFRKHLPLAQLQAFAEARFQDKATRVFVGHFHRSYHYRGRRGGTLDTLPAWCSRGWVSVLHPAEDDLRQGAWQGLLPLEARIDPG